MCGAGAAAPAIIAALLHDVGHLPCAVGARHMGRFGVVQHELIGAAYLL
jgi:predicted HD phosphohydrolase